MTLFLIAASAPVIAGWAINLPTEGQTYKDTAVVSGSGYTNAQLDPSTAEFAFGIYTEDASHNVTGFTAENTVNVTRTATPHGIWEWATIQGSLAPPASGEWDESPVNGMGQPQYDHAVRVTPSSSFTTPIYSLRHIVVD
jgi:hypothetical protein